MITICDPFDSVVTVASGTGYVDFSLCGIIKSICVKPVNAAAVYKISIVDSDGYSRMETGILTAGDNTIHGEWLIKNKQRLTVSAASVDGAYSVRIYYVTY